MYQIQTIAAAAALNTSAERLKPSKVKIALRIALQLPDPEMAAVCERLATESLIPVEHQLAEELLDALRYESYRGLTPMQATELFAWTFENHVNERSVEDSLHATFYDETKANIRDFWSARQQADLLGMHYDTYIEIAIAVHYASGGDKLPRPRDLLAPAVLAAAAHYARFEDIAEEDGDE